MNNNNSLEQRMAQSTGGAPAQRQPSLADNIKAMENQFAMAAPKGMEASQLVRDALTALRQNPQLAHCSQASVLGGLMTCAQLGLRPGVLGQAWLIPFRDKRQGGQQVAQLVIGYQGLVELAHRSGQIKSLIGRVVYENDTFDVDYGLNDTLVHKPAMRGPKGAAVAYYTIAKFNTGGHAFYVMSHDDMLEYRDKHAKSKGGPWRTDFDAMALKTTVRQLAKWLPKSTDLATALSVDEGVRVDLAPASIDHTEHAEGEVVDDMDDGVNTPAIAASQPVEPTGAPTAADRPAAKAERG